MGPCNLGLHVWFRDEPWRRRAPGHGGTPSVHRTSHVINNRRTGGHGSFWKVRDCELQRTETRCLHSASPSPWYLQPSKVTLPITSTVAAAGHTARFDCVAKHRCEQPLLTFWPHTVTMVHIIQHNVTNCLQTTTSHNKQRLQIFSVQARAMSIWEADHKTLSVHVDSATLVAPDTRRQLLAAPAPAAVTPVASAEAKGAATDPKPEGVAPSPSPEEVFKAVDMSDAAESTPESVVPVPGTQGQRDVGAAGAASGAPGSSADSTAGHHSNPPDTTTPAQGHDVSPTQAAPSPRTAELKAATVGGTGVV